ncbi:MAG TPA: hypothetical protein VEA36_03485 [Candidatus Paceibacterota bacterium]|nr:hypothetical protein [Candidatus Paceibacterota bacterium]
MNRPFFTPAEPVVSPEALLLARLYVAADVLDEAIAAYAEDLGLGLPLTEDFD